ncbi:metal ABC transporter substrate-binding protein [Fluviispira multicolorata]|uniref:Manganese/zinc/iron transport system substrate-binding protein n=1 Tax=Fluviispira multicolorata TaxID=2654512 RepID=A0A833N7R2_9BACT|nr:metal ABC transporter substrate-binding protein [Fluviispira multicolorata]KAB8033251.1 hypothetical protein GCL57_00725 [Fluviispira multicolorata]
MKHTLVKLFSFAFLSFPNICLADTQNDKIKIETSLPYIKELVQQASCNSNSFATNSIISLGVDPHIFHMTPQNRLSIAKSKVIIFIGAGLEEWIQKIPKSETQIWLELSKDMKLKKLDPNSKHNHTHNHEHNEEDHNHEHRHLELDPHIWQSPKLTKLALKKISILLKDLKPSEAEVIEKCTQNYLSKIDGEVNLLKKEIQKIPEKQRILATNHDALGYFSDEFGFKILSITGVSDDSAPTSKDLKNIILNIKKENVKAIFLESTGNMRNIQSIAHETSIKIGGELYTDSLGKKGSNADTIIGMWQVNVKTILNALKN